MSTAYASEVQSEVERAVMLLDAYRASEMAHRRAADRAKSREERETLLRKAHERARFARDLDTELSTLGAHSDPYELRACEREDGQSSWPRADDDLPSLVARTEMRVRSEIDRCLSAILPSELHTLVERHARAIGTRSVSGSVSPRR
jgi:hypothetical protein